MRVWVFDKRKISAQASRNNNEKKEKPPPSETANKFQFQDTRISFKSLAFCFDCVYSFVSDTFINFIPLIDQVPTLSLFMRIVYAMLAYVHFIILAHSSYSHGCRRKNVEEEDYGIGLRYASKLAYRMEKKTEW